MEYLKSILALFFIVCLFVPLSTCTGPVSPDSNIEPKIEYGYVLSETETVESAIAFILFAFPLLAVLLARMGKRGIIVKLISILSGAYILFMSLVHMVMATPLIWSYILALGSILYIGVTLVEVFIIWRKHRLTSS